MMKSYLTPVNEIMAKQPAWEFYKNNQLLKDTYKLESLQNKVIKAVEKRRQLEKKISDLKDRMIEINKRTKVH